MRSAAYIPLLFASALWAGAPGPSPDQVRLRKEVVFLSGPMLEGRATGTQGQVRTAKHLEQRFKEVGLVALPGPGMERAHPYLFDYTFPARDLKETLNGTDVIGLIPGTDPALKDQCILISAHHDHLGAGSLDQGPGAYYPGADDNGSGTAALLEVARLLRGTRPRRTILFLSSSGEELGLLGSKAFAAAPPLDLRRIKADINMDMIGRGPQDQISITPAQVEGAITTLTAETRRLAKLEGMTLTAEADAYWTRSDHFTFAKRGIPSIFFFGGMHRDYHKVTDTPDKLDYAKLARVVALARDLALSVADATEPPRLLPPEATSAWTWPARP